MDIKNNTKILVAIMSMEIGGAETHVLELCKALQKKGMRVYVASNGGAYEPELVECGVVHYKVPLHNKQPFNILGAYRALKKIITENDIRLVHAHARIPAFLCGFLQRKLNFRFVTTAHWVFTTKFPYNLLSNWGEKSLAVSEDIKDYLIHHYNVPKDDIYITINGIDTEKFKPSTEPVKNGKRIMSISRLDKDRSLAAHLLIEAAPVLTSKYPDTIIYLVGGGDDFNNVAEKANLMNKKLGKEVLQMTGPQVDVHKWLKECDVFVGVSRALLEAMAQGLPVVGSGNEGYMGIINEDNMPTSIATNFCYRGCGEATAQKLTTDLITILDMPRAEIDAMGKFSREFIIKNYSVDRMAEDALKLYNKVLSTCCPVRLRKTDVMISGYYGYNNSGDDLLLKSIVRDLKNRQADLSITVLSMRPKETKSQYGVNAIHRFNLFNIWRLLCNTKLLITGGGSVIQDLTSTHSLIYYLWIIKTAKRLGAKNMLYGNGIGPIKNPANMERMRKTLNEVELITLREEASRTLLEENNITSPKILVTSDPAFSLPNPDFKSAQKELDDIGIVGGFFCIALRSWKYNPPGFEEHIAQFADYVAKEYNLAVLFVPMRPSDDTEISKKTMAFMQSPAFLLENTKDMDDIRGVVALSKFTLAMRLHTLIYAINQGVPVIGLAYDPKVKWLMESIDQSSYVSVEETSKEKLIEFADDLFKNYEEVAQKIKEAGQEAQKLAMCNADLCMDLISM